MSQRPLDEPPNFSIATSHNERQNANRRIKNYIFTVSNFWMRYNDSDRKNKSILAKEVLDFIFTNGGRVRDGNQFYDQAYLNSHPTIYAHVINSMKNYISDQVTKHKKKFKVVAKNIQNFIPPPIMSPTLAPVIVSTPTATILHTPMDGILSDDLVHLHNLPHDLPVPQAIKEEISIDTLIESSVVEEVGRMKTTFVEDKGNVDSLQAAPHDFIFHPTVVLQHPISSAETIIAPLKEETSLLLMTRSRKTYERKLRIEYEPSLLVPKANEIIDAEALIMPQLIRKVVDGTYTPDVYFPQENHTVMNIISEIIGKNKIFPDFNAENFLNYSFGGIKQIGLSRICMLKLKADSKNPFENYVNNEIIDFNFIVIRR